MSEERDALDAALETLKGASRTPRGKPPERKETGDNVDPSPADPQVLKLDKEPPIETSNETTKGPETADVAILVALRQPELKFVQDVFAPEWRDEMRQGSLFSVGTMTLGDGRELTVVTASQNDMGMVPAAILATKTLSVWKPKLLAMAGICAGVKGKVQLGDIVVGKELFDYGSGKQSGDRLTPDYIPASPDEQLMSLAGSLASKANVAAEIRAKWQAADARPDTDLSVHIGAMASGAAVVADGDVIAGVGEHKRSLYAIDMESYGFARAARSSITLQKFLVAKGVQDFADDDKDDEYRDYAAFVSAHWLHQFVITKWDELES